MNIAVLLAGGVDPAFKMDIPKQFVNVYNKPIIVYTMQKFQSHPEVDAIMIACLKGWENMVQAYAKQFRIDKLKWVITGGVSGQDTSRLAADELMHSCKEDDIVIIHDAIRPMVSADVITDNIRVCRQYGNAITVVPCTAAMLKTYDALSTVEQVPRDNLKITQTPQAFFLKDICDAHKEALDKGITNSVASCTMYIELGRKLYMSQGSEKNLKLTTSEDIEIFKALLMAKKDEWMH